MPIIECLRGPFTAYIERRPHSGGRDPRRCFHELRDTRIEEARHSPIPKDLWEIISGHSKKTVSDRYGGENPSCWRKPTRKSANS